MREIYNKLDIEAAIWWIFLILFFIILPIYQVDSATLTCTTTGEVVEDKPFWLYILGIFVFDFVMILFLIAISMIGMMLAKLHNYLTKEGE